MSNITHACIQDGWFREAKSSLWPGQATLLQVSKIIHNERSIYQDILVFETTNHGKVLALDGVVQCSDRDEFAYQEMVTHLALNSHASPRSVLVIGGGDGGVLRELRKHETIESIVLCEIDGAVIDVCKRFLPELSIGFENSKVDIVVQDGFQYLQNQVDRFDVIITDSSDPVGPAQVLFERQYFHLLHGALKDGGVVITQAESQWLHLPFISTLKSFCKEFFSVVDYAYTCAPVFPSGQIGFMVCRKNSEQDVKEPVRWWDIGEESRLCKYYNRDIHRASFVLPNFARSSL